ncbi:MAG: hypothetical protein J2P24_20305 [Streptosporangiales bacterium]|nr:hypothetical protein [Streptosporangiales bacterium]MBO0892276.1 hypothetical protein [Acidothermales bacterium]
MKTVVFVIGVLVALAGAVFALQGAGVLPGSMMSGDPKWTVIGVVMVVVGLFGVFFGLRRGGRGTRGA